MNKNKTSLDPIFAHELFDFFRNHLRTLRDFNYSKNKVSISHQVIIPLATYSPWEDDKVFLDLYHNISKNTLVDKYRCYELYSFLVKNKHLTGNVIEIGVWKGGTSAVLCKALEIVEQKAKVHLIDTFEGVVKSGEKDTRYKGGEHFDTSIELVNEFLNSLNVKNYTIFKGIFPEEVAIPLNEKKYRLCHIDVDTYDSAKDSFEAIWPYMENGGAVIFDDYGFWGCEGVTEFCNGLVLKDGVVLYNLNGHAILIKVLSF